jgi:hypothetical protein
MAIAVLAGAAVAGPPGGRGDGMVPVESTVPGEKNTVACVVRGQLNLAACRAVAGDWLSHMAQWGLRPKCSDMDGARHSQDRTIWSALG